MERFRKKKKEEKLDKTNIGQYLIKNEFKNCEILKKLASEDIISAHQYVREKNDISSVSLREIRRLGIFYSFVVDTYYKDLTDMEIYKYSININFIYVITQDWLIKIIEKN